MEHAKEEDKVANTQDQFIEAVKDLLKSHRVKAVIQSLIARSNEKGKGPAFLPPSSP
jgi:hypothetical protein